MVLYFQQNIFWSSDVYKADWSLYASYGLILENLYFDYGVYVKFLCGADWPIFELKY
jgi:hypothetical protein